MKLTYPMIIHNDSDGIWAEFPDLPGCFTDGDNLTEHMENENSCCVPLRECPSYRAKHVSRFGNGRL